MVPLASRVSDFAGTWQWWQVLVQLGIPAFALAVIWYFIRKRRRHAKFGHAPQPRSPASTDAPTSS
jgi:hypothetical protein